MTLASRLVAAAGALLALGALTAPASHAATVSTCHAGADPLRPLLAQGPDLNLTTTAQTCTVRVAAATAHRAKPRLTGPADCRDGYYRLWPGGWAGATYRYRVNPRGVPGGAAGLAAIRRGHQAWDALRSNCGVNQPPVVHSQYAGPTHRHYSTTADGVNVIDFGDMRATGHNPRTTLAYTQTWWSGGHIVESDQRYNRRLAWSTTGARGRYDIQSVVTHETGHTLGIAGDYAGRGHRTLTMAADIEPGDRSKRTLGLGDVLAVQALYRGH